MIMMLCYYGGHYIPYMPVQLVWILRSCDQPRAGFRSQYLAASRSNYPSMQVVTDLCSKGYVLYYMGKQQSGTHLLGYQELQSIEAGGLFLRLAYSLWEYAILFRTSHSSQSAKVVVAMHVSQLACPPAYRFLATTWAILTHTGLVAILTCFDF